MRARSSLRRVGLRIGLVGITLCALSWGMPAWQARLARRSLDASAMSAADSVGAHHVPPDTGQTTSFTTTFGEDADYTFNPPAFTENGDGTVTDNVTGLMWQKADGGEMTWEDAGSYAAALSLGGRSDWRLPSNHELFSVLNHGGNPALDAAYFTLIR